MGRPETTWTETEERFLRRRWCRLPLSRLVTHLGRSPDAIEHKVRRLGLQSVRSWPNVLLRYRLAQALGVRHQTADRYLRDFLPAQTYYLGDEPVLGVRIKALQQWLKNPMNWWQLDVDKIREPRLRSVVRFVRRRWDDEWLTTSQAAAMFYCSNKTILNRIYDGKLPAMKRDKYYVLRSDVVPLFENFVLADGCGDRDQDDPPTPNSRQWLQQATNEIGLDEFMRL